jgi:toxin ParE1/3/4
VNYQFHEDAFSEFMSAIDYYEECSSGLGQRFATEIFEAIHRVCEFPEAWEFINPFIRRCLTKTFPYAVLYEIEPTQIKIMAVMNLHRYPNYWKNRSE